MSALQKITDAAHAVAAEHLTDIRERTQALLEESETLKDQCKRLSPDQAKDADKVWGALQTAVAQMAKTGQANGRPPNESEGESRNEELVEKLKERVK